ncbi:MAG: ATP-binding protein [Muribaculaceae bacterium]|nr:ATP-binding protein [Muribaculaceae bacterium]
MIDKRTLEFILTDQRKEIERRSEEMLCSRKEESLVDLNSAQAQVVIGLRRCGKSTLCYQALHNSDVKFAYVDFDDERLAKLQSDQLNDVLEVLYKVYGDFNYLFLDEIQNVDGWHLFVNRMLRNKMHIVVSGSNAKLLSGELATHLTGRNKEIDLFPFSFKEFCVMKGVDITTKTTKAEAFRRAAFDEYMRQGGFPELLSIDDDKSYVKNLIDNILKRDIEQRYKISYKAAFENMAHHLLNNAPTIVVSNSLAKTFHFKSDHTAKNYVDYLKQAFLLIGVRKYSQKSRVRLSHEKVYAADVAIMNYRDNAFAGENLGHRLETIVLNHLFRKCKIEGLDVYYLNESNGECDFVVCHGNTVVQAIQVSYDISAPKTKTREINGLLLAARLTGCNDLLLLTDHESAVVNHSNHTIKIQPVYEWCLEQGI